MTFVNQDAKLSGFDESFSFWKFSNQCMAVAEVEIKKISRDPIELFSRGIQPTLWLVVFGQVFSKVQGIPTGNVSYLAYICPGILAQSILFSSIFYGISVIWERDLGIIHKLLVSPAYRGALVLGKAIAAGFRGLTQAFFIYVLALLMGIELRLTPHFIVAVIICVALGSAVFATLSLVIACVVKTRERFMWIGQLLTLPLFFASNAIYPVGLMPKWLQAIAIINPLTYLVDALRGFMIEGGVSQFGLLFDFLVLTLGLIVLTFLASKTYTALVQ